MSFGQQLRELRKDAGLSQTELAAQSGTSIDTLRNWEQDRALPKIDAASRLAKALGVSLDRLAVLEPAPKRPKRVPSPRRRRPVQ